MRVTGLSLPLSVLLALAHCASPAAAHEAAPTGEMRATTGAEKRAAFLQQHCGDCHGADTQSGGFDLTALQDDLGDRHSFEQWVRIHDRIERGEMPPADTDRPPAALQQAFLRNTATRLEAADRARRADDGRAAVRRLSRSEYEHALRDLLALPGLEVKELLPSDGRRDGFDKVGESLDISPVQISQYLAAAEHALDQAICTEIATPASVRQKIMPASVFSNALERNEGLLIKGMQVDPLLPKDWPRLQPFTPEKLAPYGITREDILTSNSSVGFTSATNSNTRRNFFTAPRSAHYRIRCTAWSFSYRDHVIEPNDRTEVAAIWAENRLLGLLDAPSMSPRVHEVTVWLNKADKVRLEPETIAETADQLTRHRGPGIAVDWLEVEGPLVDQWPPESHRRLFGDLPLTMPAQINVKSTARRLLVDFLPRAFRRPVGNPEVARYVALVEDRATSQAAFPAAMRHAYASALCSTHFLFRREEPGPLDDHAIATRLSLWLWNSVPDDTLRDLADANRLRDKDVLAAQVNRMLADPKSSRFIETFLDQWLQLENIDQTVPDKFLYSEVSHRYDGMNAYVRESMLMEPRAYFRELLDKDLGAATIVASDFAMVNDVLADLYALPGNGFTSSDAAANAAAGRIDGSAIRRVNLPPTSKRGGFITQAGVLKVTANGTTTSPVVRGAFINERILGRPIPPPPPGIPTVDPDTRGASTIRELLAKHRNDASCAGCHAKLDPPGFALESFDVVGGYRERYRSLDKGDRVNATLRNTVYGIRYKNALPVDPSGTLEDGRTFADIDGLRSLLLTDRRGLARSFLSHMLIYATGSDVHFADRQEVERILDQTEATGYGLRSMIHAIAQSPLFQTK
jgi:mono/diheme cytochrome c family protein